MADHGGMKRLMQWAIGFSLFFLFGFLLAERMGWLSETQVRGWMASGLARADGRAWIGGAAFALLAADIVLPVPSSVVMTLSGAALGFLPGLAISFAGCMTASLAGYGACRRWGRPAYVRMVGDDEDRRVRRLFERYGAWVILLGRGVPLLPEVTGGLAGVSAYPFGAFLALSAAGTIPVCALFAWAGCHGMKEGTGVFLLAALAVPAAGFAALRWVERRRDRTDA
jgi:uncharacterized membrane protein YdjX (TVP38/TMEM64 family)